MTLSKKHFKAIATILKDCNANEKMINAFCSYFKSENALFNEEKFKDAVLN